MRLVPTQVTASEGAKPTVALKLEVAFEIKVSIAF
jgi:hypothetical protein